MQKYYLVETGIIADASQVEYLSTSYQEALKVANTLMQNTIETLK